MRTALLALLALLASACSTANRGAATGTGGDGGSGAAPLIGGDRPVTVQVPSGYQQGVPAPLLILLHGYAVNGAIEELYLGLGSVADEKGFLYAHPDGTADSLGNDFWNATDACCNYDGSTVDDSGYLLSVIEQISAHWTVDPDRVYFLGHSNGGFMSYRMACDHADRIAAIVSLAGAMWEDPGRCHPVEPVDVLEIHGDADTEVLYAGSPGTSMPGNGPYPSAETTVEDWVTFDGCSAAPDPSSPPLDLDMSIAGAETTVQTWAAGCKPGGSAALWTIHGGTHVPDLGDTFRSDVFAFFLAHAKP